ncbi:MAG: hypothetical protein Q3976_01540 [Corynebacterium sp.]|nr:hypothetical protein [Corynebacterium sp.]
MKTFRSLLAALAIITVSIALVSCTSEDPADIATTQPTSVNSLTEARRENLSHNVNDTFPDHPVVLSDDSETGAATAEYFFDKSDTLIIAEDTLAAQLRAASIAVVTHAPMLTMTEQGRATVISELERLGASYVLLVGNVSLAQADGDVRVIQDPGTADSLSDLTALEFKNYDIEVPAAVVPTLASLDPNEYVELTASWAPETAEAKDVEKAEENLSVFPVQSRRDADTAPYVVASYTSRIADIATARSFGAQVRVMSYPDPRYAADDLLQVVGLEDHSVAALGADFGTDESFAQRIAMATAVWDADNALDVSGRDVSGEDEAAEESAAAAASTTQNAEGSAGAALRSDSGETGTSVALSQPVIFSRDAASYGDTYTASQAAMPGVHFGVILDPAELSEPEVDGLLALAPRALLTVNTAADLDTYESWLTQPHVGVEVHSDDPAEVAAVITKLASIVADNELPQKIVQASVLPADSDAGQNTNSVVSPEEAPASPSFLLPQEIVGVFATETGAAADIADIVEQTQIPEEAVAAGWQVGYGTQTLNYNAQASYPWNLEQWYIAQALGAASEFPYYPWVLNVSDIQLNASVDVGSE